MSDLGTVDFALAVLKGTVERGDGTAYFGSLMAYKTHQGDAIRRGLVSLERRQHPEGFEVMRPTATALGARVYEASGIADLPKQGRAYTWDWSRVTHDVEMEGVP